MTGRGVKKLVSELGQEAGDELARAAVAVAGDDDVALAREQREEALGVAVGELLRLEPLLLGGDRLGRDILQKVIRANSRLSGKQNETLH